MKLSTLFAVWRTAREADRREKVHRAAVSREPGIEEIKYAIKEVQAKHVSVEVHYHSGTIIRINPDREALTPEHMSRMRQMLAGAMPGGFANAQEIEDSLRQIR